MHNTYMNIKRFINGLWREIYTNIPCVFSQREHAPSYVYYKDDIVFDGDFITIMDVCKKTNAVSGKHYGTAQKIGTDLIGARLVIEITNETTP